MDKSLALARHRIFITITVFIFIAVVIFAQATQRVVFTFSNGGSPVSNVNFFIYFPAGIRPVNLTSKMIWNPALKTLTIAVGEVKPYENLSLEVTVDGPTGDYELKGQLIGQWSQVGQGFQSDLIAVQTKIRKVGTSVSIIEAIRSNPKVVAAAKNVAAPAAVALEVAGGGALASSMVSANASLAANVAEVLRFLQFLGFGFFRLRRQKPWGRIANQLTGKAIKGATVRVFESTFQKLKDTQFSDESGRFGFLVSPGTYYLVVSKTGFQDVKTDLIAIKVGAEALDINITLIPESGLALKTKPFLKFLASVVKIINKINPFILIIGTLAGVGIVIILPSVFNFIVLGTYLILDIVKFIFSKKVLKSFGQVIDKRTRQPLALSVIRIFDADKNWLLTSRVSDAEGRFKFLLIPGNYYVTCAKAGYKPFISQPLAVSKASLLNWDLTLEPEA